MGHDRSLYIGYSKENLKIHMGVPSPAFLPSLTLPSPAFISLSPSPPFLYPLPLEVGSHYMQLGGLKERCKLPQRGLGRSPSRNRFWCIIALKSEFGGNDFNEFSKNQLTKFHPLPSGVIFKDTQLDI